MEETVIDNGLQHVENKENVANDKSSKKTAVIGGVAGAAIGAAAVSAASLTDRDEPAEVAESEKNLEGVDGTAHLDGSVPVANVSDDLSFEKAFEEAREQVGAGGVFVWHGKVYHTYSKEEWDGMSENQRAEFGGHMDIAYNVHEKPTAHHAQEEVAATATPTAATGTQDGSTAATTVDAGETAQAETVEVATPDVSVVNYGTIATPDGTLVDVAVLSDGQDVGAVLDVDRDGTGDYLVSDDNHNGRIDRGEVEDISDMNLSMRKMHDDYLANNGVHDATPDVSVVEYGTITAADGTQMEAAVVTDGRDEAIIVDVTGDGYANVVASDLNDNGKLDEGEVADISDYNIPMSSYRNEYLSDNGMEPDDGNDGIDYGTDNDASLMYDA